MDADAKDATDSAETADAADVVMVVDVTTDADSATTVVCGSSFSCAAVVDSAITAVAADVDVATTAACGSSFSCAAVADSAITAVDAAMVADAAADADVDAKPSFVYLAIPGTEFLLRPFSVPIIIILFLCTHTFPPSFEWFHHSALHSIFAVIHSRFLSYDITGSYLVRIFLYLVTAASADTGGFSMAGRISKPMTPFDKSVTPSYLYKLKLFLPFLPPASQRFLGIYIKFLEFRVTLDSFRGFPVHTFSLHSLDELTPYMDEQECNMMEQISSMIQMMEMFQGMSSDPGIFSGAHGDSDHASGNPFSNPLDFFKNMMSGEEQSEFQNYMNLFDQELDQCEKGDGTHERMDESSGS